MLGFIYGLLKVQCFKFFGFIFGNYYFKKVVGWGIVVIKVLVFYFLEIYFKRDYCQVIGCYCIYDVLVLIFSCFIIEVKFFIIRKNGVEF